MVHVDDVFLRTTSSRSKQTHSISIKAMMKPGDKLNFLKKAHCVGQLRHLLKLNPKIQRKRSPAHLQTPDVSEKLDLRSHDLQILHWNPAVLGQWCASCSVRDTLLDLQQKWRSPQRRAWQSYAWSATWAVMNTRSFPVSNLSKLLLSLRLCTGKSNDICVLDALRPSFHWCRWCTQKCSSSILLAVQSASEYTSMQAHHGCTLTEKHSRKKKERNGVGGVLLGCSPACCRFVLLFVGSFCPKCHGVVVAWWWWLKRPSYPAWQRPYCAQAQRVSFCVMAIKGEVHVRSLMCLPAATFLQGRYVIQPFECKIIGTGEGLARIKASIHTVIESFDDEEWRIITLTVGHLDSQTKYTDLFAPSCGSIGDFIDITTRENHAGDKGYVVPPQMRDYGIQVRNFDGAFYERVFPFDPSYFCTKVRPTGALLFTPHHSQLTLLQHLCVQFQYAKKLLQLLSDVPKYCLEADGAMSLDKDHRWKAPKTLPWLRTHGLYSVPRNIKEEIGNLVYNSDRGRASNDPPPGL